MGNAVRVPASAVQGGKLISAPEPVEVKIIKFRYCSNKECGRYGHFWEVQERSQLGHCPECDKKTVNHTIDSEQRTDMVKAFAAGVLDYIRGEVVWRMVGVTVKATGPYGVTIVPPRIFIGNVDAGKRISVFARPVMQDQMTDKELRRAVEAKENAEALIAAVESKPQNLNEEVTKDD